jgi:Lon protease-like protein
VSARPEQETIPLFPLSAVLFPGAPLPLQIFEPRYRTLVAELLELEPEERRFGVVAIQAGSEAGMPLPQIFPIGCEARVRRIEPMPDGRSALLAVGATRFRLLEVDTTSHPYLSGTVRWLEESEGEPGLAEAVSPRVRTALQSYTATLMALTGSGLGGSDSRSPFGDGEPPIEPTQLSYFAASSLLLPLRERQALLELADTATRLRTALTLLRREQLLMTTLQAISAPDLFRLPRATMN